MISLVSGWQPKLKIVPYMEPNTRNDLIGIGLAAEVAENSALYVCKHKTTGLTDFYLTAELAKCSALHVSTCTGLTDFVLAAEKAERNPPHAIKHRDRSQ